MDFHSLARAEDASDQVKRLDPWRELLLKGALTTHLLTLLYLTSVVKFHGARLHLRV